MSDSEDAVVRVLGSDPWLRFDLWAGRAWEATEAAVKAARELDSSADSLSPLIITLFNSAQVAKDIAELVNPIDAVSQSRYNDPRAIPVGEIVTDIIIEGDGLD